MKASEGKKIRLAIVEDHPTFRMGLVALINKQADMQVVAEYDSAEALLAAVTTVTVDIVLMDLRLPGMGGVEATLALSQHPTVKVKVVVLTTFNTDEDIFRAMQSGAQSYLLKDMSTAEIVGVIRSVHQGHSLLPDSVARLLDQRESRQTLTAREHEVLVLLVKGRSNKEISSVLFISEDTVKSHLKTLYAKLGVRDRTDAAITALRHGIVHLE